MSASLQEDNDSRKIKSGSRISRTLASSQNQPYPHSLCAESTVALFLFSCGTTVYLNVGLSTNHLISLELISRSCQGDMLEFSNVTS